MAERTGRSLLSLGGLSGGGSRLLGLGGLGGLSRLGLLGRLGLLLLLAAEDGLDLGLEVVDGVGDCRPV